MMNKLLLTLLPLIFCLHASAADSTGKSGPVVLKGNAKNHPQDFWDYGISNIMGTEFGSVPIDKNGDFSKTLHITYVQDFMLDVGGGIILFVVPGDTLQLNWDFNDVANTFKVFCTNPGRQQELNLMLSLSNQFRLADRKLMQELHDSNINDSLRFERIKSHLSNKVATAGSYPLTRYSNKIFCDLYYESIKLMSSAKLSNKYTLSFEEVFPERIMKLLLLSEMNINTLDEGLFLVSRIYREFIFDRVRFNNPFDRYRFITSTAGKLNLTLNDCYQGAASLYASTTVLDWYLAKALMFGFTGYSFEDSEKAYEIFFPQIKTTFYRDTLARFYENIQRLKPGRIAPKFILKNEEGKMISLSDFKGKLVYLDFWGVYCGPCRNDIENYLPKLHEKYKNKDIAFVNVCVDVKEKLWKESLKKLALQGTNLIATDGVNNPVCKDYHVNGIPKYVLIDKEGKILQANASHPAELLFQGDNIIDKHLK